MSRRPALLDTSVLIARESGRSLDGDAIPDETAVCVVTIAELRLGVLPAADTTTRAQWLVTVEEAAGVKPLAVTAEAARRWVELRMQGSTRSAARG